MNTNDSNDSRDPYREDADSPRERVRYVVRQPLARTWIVGFGLLILSCGASLSAYLQGAVVERRLAESSRREARVEEELEEIRHHLAVQRAEMGTIGGASSGTYGMGGGGTRTLGGSGASGGAGSAMTPMLFAIGGTGIPDGGSLWLTPGASGRVMVQY